MKHPFNYQQFFDLGDCYFADIFEGTENVWEVLTKIEPYIKKQFSSGKLKGNYREKEYVFVGERTVIEEGAYIKGPAIIGKNCIIAHGAYIRENVILGDGVRIWHGTEIKQSIMLSNAIGIHLGYIGDSIIGSSVNIAAGTIIANLRLDKQVVSIRNGEEKIETGLKKFGAIIGDGSQIGVNAVFNPGTLLGKYTIVYPLTSVSGVHDSNSIIK